LTKKYEFDIKILLTPQHLNSMGGGDVNLEVSGKRRKGVQG
jgi:hypothetical protein